MLQAASAARDGYTRGFTLGAVQHECNSANLDEYIIQDTVELVVIRSYAFAAEAKWQVIGYLEAHWNPFSRHFGTIQYQS